MHIGNSVRIPIAFGDFHSILKLARPGDVIRTTDCDFVVHRIEVDTENEALSHFHVWRPHGKFVVKFDVTAGRLVKLFGRIALYRLRTPSSAHLQAVHSLYPVASAEPSESPEEP